MSRAAIKPLLAALLLIATHSLAFGQAGSIGGVVGKTDKSISGEETSSSGARKASPTRPTDANQSTKVACKQITADIAGTWNSSSPSSETEDIHQGACRFTATLSNQFFSHMIVGRYLDGSSFSLAITRTNRATGCTTMMFGNATVQSAARMQWVITRTDGKCDLPASYHETRSWTR